MMKLYRSGSITPLEKVKNINSSQLDELTYELQNIRLNRSESVYATFLRSEAETVWEEYRSYSLNMDSTLYEITIPDRFMNENIYAYDLDLYDDFWLEMSELDDPWILEKVVQRYVETRVHIKDWEEFLLCHSEAVQKKWEVLIPYHIAEQCIWEAV